MTKSKKEIINIACGKVIKNNCIAIFHNGSGAIGLGTDKSDIDLVMIIEDFSHRNLIMEELSKIFSLEDEGTHNGKYWCSAFLMEGVKIDISFFKKSDFLEYTKHFYDSVDNYKKHVSRIKHKVIDSKIVYDPFSMLEKAVLLIRKYPKIFRESLIKELLVDIKHNVDYINFSGLRNRYESQFVARDIITPACMAIYALNDSFFMLGFKRLHHDLPRFSLDFMELIDSLLENAFNYNPDNMVLIGEKIYTLIETYKK